MAMNNEKAATGKFSMKPGSKGMDSPTTFRMDSPLKQLGMQDTMGTGAMGGGSPMMKTEKCHGSDAACMKRNRAARKASSSANHAKRAKEYSKTGDKKKFYKDSKPTTFAKGSLKGVGEKVNKKK